MIISSENPNIKFLKSLKKRRVREKSNCFVVEGFKLFREALKSDAKLENIFYSRKSFESLREDRELLEETINKYNIKSHYISDNLFNSLCDTVTPQGILAVFKFSVPFIEINKLDFGKNIWLLLYEIQDPGNLGTIIRTADAAGVSGIFLTSGTVDILNTKVIRASMGAVFHIRFLKILDVESFILSTKKKGVLFISTFVSGKTSFRDIEYIPPLVLIVGNEGHGLPESIISLSDIVVTIPIYGFSESLNVSVATGVILYEIADRLFLR